MSKRIPAITQKQVANMLPKRPRDSHKGHVRHCRGDRRRIRHGRRAAAGGTRRAQAGRGCVHVGLLADNAPIVDVLQPELMLHRAADALRLPEVEVCAIGCGTGRDMAAQKLLYDALNSDAALVLDADALNILALRPDLRTLLLARKSAAVLTPHPGEAARLLACEIGEVQADRVARGRNWRRSLPAAWC